MSEFKNFMIQSLSVSTGLVIYSLIVYISYLLFFQNSKEENTETLVEEKKEEKIENFDILEDVE